MSVAKLDEAIARRGGDAAVVLDRESPRAINGREVVLTPASTLRPTPVRWLWNGWLARGKMHILAGAPGQGKTTIAMAMAATITSGGRWPDGTHSDGGEVVIWSGEDDPTDTLLPRLLAMGADPERVHFVGDVLDRKRGARPFDPAKDVVLLESAIACRGSVRLLVVDPIASAVSGDSHNNSEVRRSLQPLVDLAAETDCAILGITHFGKGGDGKDPTERVLGSVAFGAVARVVMVAAKVQSSDDGERRILARSKSNIGADGGGVEYVIQHCDLPGHPDVNASQILWGQQVAGTARELLAITRDADDADTADVHGWLQGVLVHGGLSVSEVKRLAERDGFAFRTVQRASKSLGVRSQRLSFGASPVWTLPQTATAQAIDYQSALDQPRGPSASSATDAPKAPRMQAALAPTSSTESTIRATHESGAYGEYGAIGESCDGEPSAASVAEQHPSTGAIGPDAEIFE